MYRQVPAAKHLAKASEGLASWLTGAVANLKSRIKRFRQLCRRHVQLVKQLNQVLVVLATVPKLAVLAGFIAIVLAEAVEHVFADVEGK